jgi:hypothetical protein
MQPLRPGEVSELPGAPGQMADEWTSGRAEPTSEERLASPYGILVIRVQPPGAQILLDGEIWLGGDDQSELVIHVPEGWHELEVRHEGYQTFRTEIELSEGARTRLNVRLVR